MAIKISKFQFPQWPFNHNLLFDSAANWIDQAFFGSKYNPTTEKVMVIALFTNIFGLHRIYAGRKISAVFGWLLLLMSMLVREYISMVLIWLAIDMIRICLGNYGRLKSNRRFDFIRFKELFFNKVHIRKRAISGGISVLALSWILLFAPQAADTSNRAIVSHSDLYVSQTDAAYKELQELQNQIESNTDLIEKMKLFEQNRDDNWSQIDDLQKVISGLNTDKQNLKKDITKLSKEKESLADEVAKLSEERDKLAKEVGATTTTATKATTKTTVKTTDRSTTKKSTIKTTTKKTTTTTIAKSENTYDYDALQTIFLKINYDTTEKDIEKYIKDYKVEYTKNEYNGYNIFKLAYDNKELQRYADAGDNLEVQFSQKDGSLMLAEYDKYDTSMIALLYNYGNHWELQFKKPNNKYSGYYYYTPGEHETGIVIEYENGRSRKTHYHACNNAESALQKCMVRLTD